MLVAHPDDEILWGGGLPIRFPGDWTIIACSIPRKDPVRAFCFFRVCEALGAKGWLLPQYETTNSADPEELLPNLFWLNELRGFDRIVTHGADGEYGHRHHKQLNEYVNSITKGRQVTTFGFGKGRHRLELNSIEVEKKLQAFKNYDYIRDYGQVKCPAWEALRAIHYNKDPNIQMGVETYNGDWFVGK